MIEYLFVAPDAHGEPRYTPLGARHLQLLARYEAAVTRTVKALHADCARFRPVAGSYSPYGVLYGFSSQLLEHMALKATQPDAAVQFSVEDVFVAGPADTLAWVGGWRKLPHVPRDVAKRFEYPQSFAEQVFERIERALTSAAAPTGTAGASGRLLVVAEGATTGERDTAAVAALPARYVLSTDVQRVAAGVAQACTSAQLLRSRTEGELLISYVSARGWTAITKDVLTEVVGAGRDAKLEGVPQAAARALRLLYPRFVVAG
jgi:hypothetical protein